MGFSGFSQTDLNAYKYIIVPKKFETFKNANEYQTSTLVKYLFTGKGFNATYDDDLPEDLKMNRCLGLMAYLEDESTMFTTKATIVLKDCNGLETFRSMQGSSKAKEYKEAYNEAIKEAMRSLNGVAYSYTGNSENQAPITVSFKNDVKKLDGDKTDTDTAMAPKKKQVKLDPNPAVTQIATETTQYYKDMAPTESNIIKGAEEKPSPKILDAKKREGDDIWYAQATENGYQLVDSSPKVRMRLLKSSADNVFMAQTDTKNGMVFQKEGNWVFEYYENDQLVQQELAIKF